MLQGKIGWMAASVMVMVLGLVGLARAQDGGDNADRGDRRGGVRDQAQDRGGNAADRMAQFREEAAKRMQESLGVTDEEWKLLQPKIDKVQTLSRQLRGQMMRGMFRRGNRPGAPAEAAPAAEQTPVEKAAAALQQLVDNKDAKPEDVKAALEAYRAARAKTLTELQTAQKELKEVVTAQQEAKLVLAGILE